MLGTEERRRLDIGEGSSVRYCKPTLQRFMLDTCETNGWIVSKIFRAAFVLSFSFLFSSKEGLFLLIFRKIVFGSSFRYACVNKCNHLSTSVTNKICHIPRR